MIVFLFFFVNRKQIVAGHYKFVELPQQITCKAVEITLKRSKKMDIVFKTSIIMPWIRVSRPAIATAK